MSRWLGCLLCLTAAGAAELVCVGVLGNSGEAGAGLVRYGLGRAAAPAVGVGVVVDPAGYLWSRAGDGVVNRYAVDGRLVGQWPAPTGARGRDQQDTLTLAAGRLVLKQGDRLYTLPLDAAPGTAFQRLGELTAKRLSFGSHEGWLAAGSDRTVSLIHPATGEVRELPPLEGNLDQLELGPEGEVYAVIDGRLELYRAGRRVTDGWPKRTPGERCQLLDGEWFGHAWHGTIRRHDADLEPAPGVVLGGASGSFIGHLDENPDVENGRGVAKLRGDLFAVCGNASVLQLLGWREAESRFEIIRRIGAAAAPGGLGLDSEGRVYYRSGVWRWSDGPDAPLQHGVPMLLGAQAVLLGDTLLAPGWQYGDRPRLLWGRLDTELKATGYDQIKFAKDVCATACYRDDQGPVLLVATPKGAAEAHRLAGDGSYRATIGPVPLTFTEPTGELTSFGVRGETLLAGVDGQVVELVRDGAGWRERSRWRGPDGNRFGAAIYLTCADDRLWLTDRDRQRVLCFAPDGSLLASFGETDTAGSELGQLAGPTIIAASGRRAVVYDAGNQRLVKLELR